MSPSQISPVYELRRNLGGLPGLGRNQNRNKRKKRTHPHLWVGLRAWFVCFRKNQRVSRCSINANRQLFRNRIKEGLQAIRLESSFASYRRRVSLKEGLDFRL